MESILSLKRFFFHFNAQMSCALRKIAGLWAFLSPPKVYELRIKIWKEAHMEDPVPVKEEYTYQVGKIQFIVTPVYKDKGESMRDILLKLMLADLEPA